MGLARMTLDQIKQAISQGKRVFCYNDRYEVITVSGYYWIVCDKGLGTENSVKLVWSDGETLNAPESEFYTKD